MACLARNVLVWPCVSSFEYALSELFCSGPGLLQPLRLLLCARLLVNCLVRGAVAFVGVGGLGCVSSHPSWGERACLWGCLFAKFAGMLVGPSAVVWIPCCEALRVGHFWHGCYIRFQMLRTVPIAAGPPSPFLGPSSCCFSLEVPFVLVPLNAGCGFMPSGSDIAGQYFVCNTL